MEGRGSREWLTEAFASWLDVLAVDLLGYAIMGNHFHLVVRTRPDVARAWSATEVRRRWMARSAINDGQPGSPATAPIGPPLAAGELAAMRAELAHPGPMLKAVKEGFARRLNIQTGASGHVWEGRYHDVAMIDAGGVLACLVYVDLNPFRAGLVTEPVASEFCSARHRRVVDRSAADSALGRRLHRVDGCPLLDDSGQELGLWSWNAVAIAEVTAATATAIQNPTAVLPRWVQELLPRLGVRPDAWIPRMGSGGTITGNVLGSTASRRRASPDSRMASDKSGLF